MYKNHTRRPLHASKFLELLAPFAKPIVTHQDKTTFSFPIPTYSLPHTHNLHFTQSEYVSYVHSKRTHRQSERIGRVVSQNLGHGLSLVKGLLQIADTDDLYKFCLNTFPIPIDSQLLHFMIMRSRRNPLLAATTSKLAPKRAWSLFK